MHRYTPSNNWFICIYNKSYFIIVIGSDKSWREKRIEKLLGEVGIPTNAINRYVHQFSGGQRQRIGIARALAEIGRAHV